MAAEVTVTVNAQDNFSGVLGNFGSILTGIESVVNLVGQAFDAAVNVITPFIDSASESEQAVARLEGVLRATGNAVGLSSDELQNMADSLQGVTRFSDETILAGEAMLLTFRNIGSETFERTVPAMLDMAEIFGSVDSAALQLGKALNDPLTGISALQRVGITFSDTQKEMIKNFMETGDIASAQNVILSELEAQVGGLSEAMGQTFSGQAAIFNNQLDSIRETIGAALLPAIATLTGRLGELVANPEVIQFITDFSEGLGAAATNLVDFITNVDNLDLSNLTQMFSDWAASVDWGAISRALAEGINNIDWTPVGLEIRTALINIINGLSIIISQIDWSALGSAVAGAVSEFVVGLTQDTMSDIASSIIEDLQAWEDIGRRIVVAIASGFVNAFTGLFAVAAGRFTNFIDYVKGLLGVSSPSSIFTNIGRDLVLGLIGGWDNLFDNFLDAVTSGIDAILELFAPILALFGFDVPGGGTTGGGSTGGTTGGGTGNRTTPPGDDTGGGEGGIVYNFYGDVYFGEAGTPGADGSYVCLPTQIDVGGLGGSPSGGTSGSTGGRPGRPR